MKNFKKVMALALALAMVLSTMTTAFAATANADKAQVLYDLDLFDGKSADEYMPALEDAATAPEALKLIGTALGWTVDADATTTFEDVPAWAVPWVAKAVELEITNGVSDTEFGSDVIDGKRVVTWFLRALGYDMNEAWNDTETLAATAGLTIPTATLRDDVVGVIYQGLMTTPVGADATLIETIVLDDAAKTAIAEDAGLVDASLAIEAAAITGVKTVEVKLNKAVDTDTTTVQVKKGAAIYSSTVAWNDAKNTATVTCVTNLDNNVGTYTAVVTTADETLTKDFEVADEAAATIAVSTTTVDDAAAAAEVTFVISNQYGEDMEVAATAVTAAAYDVTTGKVVAVDNSAADSTLTLDTDTVTADDIAVGDVIRLTISYLGMTTQANLTVVDAATSATFGFGAVTLADEDDVRLTAADTGVGLGYTLLDQYGVETTLATHVAGADAVANQETISGVLFISSDVTVVDPDDFAVDADGVLTFAAGAEGTAVVTAIINETGAVATTSIVVNGASAVDTVTISAPTSVVADGETVELALVAIDQYGATLDNDSAAVQAITFANASIDADGVLTTDALVEGDFTVQAGTGADADAYGTVTFTVEAAAYANAITAVSFDTYIESTASVTLTDDNVTAVDQYNRAIDTATSIIGESDTEANITDGTGGAGGTDTLTAAAEGSAVVTVSYTFGGATVTKDVTVNSVASGSIEAYTVDAIDTLFAQVGADGYDVAVALSGVDADGNAVKLVTTAPDFITSSNEAVAKADATNLKVDGVAAGTAVISAWVDGAVVGTTTVTVSEDTPVATAVSFADTVETTIAVTVDTTDVSDDLVVEDQYGVDLVAEGDLDPTAVGFWTISTDNSGVNDVAISAAGVIDVGSSVATDVLTVGYVTTNGVTTTIEITMVP